MIRIAIVEDEDLYVQQLNEYIDRYKKERNQHIKVSLFSDGEDIVDSYSGNFDIILMDIQMQFMDGMTAAEQIRALDPEVIIVFITNMIQYAIRGYEVDALDYVVKPVEYFAFSQRLDKAIARIKKHDKKHITFSTKNGSQKLLISDIYYIESQGHEVLYRSVKGDFRSRITLKELECEMCTYGFCRSSKSFLVNLRLVDGISGSNCLINDEKLPISRVYKKSFMEQLMRYMDEE